MKKIKVAVVDDHPIVRDGLKTILDLQERFEVVGTADNGKSAVELATHKQPDVILMDIYMPVMNGLDAVQEIKRQYPDMHVLLITSQPDDDNITKAIIFGVSGFILKDWETEEIVQTIDAAISGRMVLPSLASQSIAEGLAGRHQTTPIHSENKVIELTNQQSWGQWDRVLTIREKQIALLLLSHFSNEEIANTLFLSIGTVKNYLSTIYKTLGVTGREDAKQALLKGEGVQWKLESLSGERRRNEEEIR